MRPMKTKTRPLSLYWGDRPSIVNIDGGAGNYTYWQNAAGGDSSLHETYMLNRYAIDMRTALNPFSATHVTDGMQTFSSTRLERPLFNDCENRVSRAVCLPCSFMGRQQNRAGAVSSYVYRRFYRSPIPNPYSILPSVPDPLGLSELEYVQRLAWAEMQPRFEGELSMLNFLIELKDFKSIYKIITKDGLNLISSLRKFFRSIKRKAREGKIDLLSTRTLAELHLTNEYAIQPLIKDLHDITSQLYVKVKEAEEKFQRDGDEGYVSHWGQYLAIKDEMSPMTYKYTWRRSGAFTSTYFNATMDYKYKYTCRSFLDAFAHFWGLNVTYKRLWDAVPFSFLADYVSNLGRSIDAAERDHNVLLTVSQYCESLRTTYAVGTFIDPARTALGLVVNGKYYPTSEFYQLVAGDQGTHYRREVCAPNKGTVGLRIKMPKTRHQYNMLALLRCFM